MADAEIVMCGCWEGPAFSHLLRLHRKQLLKHVIFKLENSLPNKMQLKRMEHFLSLVFESKKKRETNLFMGNWLNFKVL